MHVRVLVCGTCVYVHVCAHVFVTVVLVYEYMGIHVCGYKLVIMKCVLCMHTKLSSSTFEFTAPGVIHCRYIHSHDVQCSIKGQRSELACLQAQ